MFKCSLAPSVLPSRSFKVVLNHGALLPVRWRHHKPRPNSIDAPATSSCSFLCAAQPFTSQVSITGSGYRPNTLGDGTHPCLTAMPTGHHTLPTLSRQGLPVHRAGRASGQPACCSTPLLSEQHPALPTQLSTAFLCPGDTGGPLPNSLRSPVPTQECLLPILRCLRLHLEHGLLVGDVGATVPGLLPPRHLLP